MPLFVLIRTIGGQGVQGAHGCTRMNIIYRNFVRERHGVVRGNSVCLGIGVAGLDGATVPGAGARGQFRGWEYRTGIKFRMYSFAAPRSVTRHQGVGLEDHYV